MDSKETISASDVGLYTYCPKAWQLKRQGYASSNRESLIRGSQYHESFGRRLHFFQLLQAILIVLIVLVVLFILIRGEVF